MTRSNRVQGTDSGMKPGSTICAKVVVAEVVEIGVVQFARAGLVPIGNKQKMGSGCGAITGSNELANPGGSHLLTGRKPDFRGAALASVNLISCVSDTQRIPM